MKVPYVDYSQNIAYGKSMGRNPRNPFDGTSEMDIAALIERVLGDDRNIESVASEDTITAIRLEAMSANEAETGGALTGTWRREEDGSISIALKIDAACVNEARQVIKR